MLNKLKLLVIIIFSSFACPAQSLEESYLLNKRQFNLVDTSIVNRHNSLARKNQNIYPDSFFYYSRKALQEAIEIKYPLGIADAYISLARYQHFNLNNSRKANYYFQGALKLYRYLIASSNIKDSIILNNGIATAYNGMGVCERQMGNNVQALKYMNEAHTIGISINNEGIISRSLHNFAVIYDDLGDTDSALNYAFKSLKLKYKMKDDFQSAAQTLGLISAIYGEQNDYNNSLKYALQSFNLLNKNSVSDKYSLILVNINLAINYEFLHNFNMAAIHLKNAYNLIYKFKVFVSLPGYYTQLAGLYVNLGENNKAIEYNQLAINLAGTENNRDNTLITYYNLASIYYNMGKYTKSLQYALKALKIDNEMGNDVSRTNLRQNLIIKIYEKLNNPKKALEYSKDLNAKLDSFANLSTTQNMSKIKALSDFEETMRSEKENQRVQQLKLKQDLERQKIIITGVIVSAILLLVISVLIVINYSNKVKAKQQMMVSLEENHQIFTKNLIREQEVTTLQNIINGQELERKRIAQELHDGVGSSLAAIKLKLATISENRSTIDKNLENVIVNVDLVYSEVRTISHNLIPPNLNYTSFTNVLDNLINDYRNNSKANINIDYLSIEKLNSINTEFQVALYRILQELLKNAINHSECSLIEIAINNYEKEMTVVFEDNGTGFDMNEKKFGIGLRNIQSRVNTLNGNLIIDAKLGRGSAFYISLNV
jgi:signal transduction histidine kinase